MRLDEDIDAIISGRAALTHYQQGDILYRPDDPSKTLWIVRAGRVHVTRLPPVIPYALIEAIAEPGWVIGAIGAYLGEARRGTATILEPTTLTVLAEDRFSALRDRAPNFEGLVSEFIGRSERRHRIPLPDAFGPLTDNAFTPPRIYATAVMPLPEELRRTTRTRRPHLLKLKG